MTHITHMFNRYIRQPGKRLLRRVCLKLAQLFEEPCQDNDETPSLSPVAWKQQALADFTAWLEQAPVDEPQQDVSRQMDGCDLYTLLSEFMALKQEIKFQNREQNKALRTQAGIVEAFQAASALFDQKTKDLATLEKNIRTESERKTVLLFLDIRDALVRGLSNSREAEKSKSLFKRFGPNKAGVSQGYEMALRRFDRALFQLDVKPIQTKNQPFDPTLMEAVDRKDRADTPPGMVLEEYEGGFVRHDEVLRNAKVVVSE